MIAAERKPCVIRGNLKALVRDLESWEGPCDVLEVLVEGPRGTGKSTGSLLFLVWNVMCRVPGVRILIVRKTRESLSRSFCPTFEDDVIPPDMRALVVGDARPGNRSEYVHPNGSWAGLVGLDRPSKYHGMNIDIVVLEEASELTWKQVEPFVGAVRQFTPGMHWQLILALTNPDAPGHWLNQRAKAGQMRRVTTTLRDNPKWYTASGEETEQGTAFLKSLERYTGVARDRHVLGLWRGAEGMVWENYDDRIHLVEKPLNLARAFGVKSYFAACDWGFAQPGSLSVYGVTNDRYLVRVAQAYHTKKTTDWWADRAIEFVADYNLSKILCDPSRPDQIKVFNDRLTRAGHSRIARGADNKKASGGAGDMGGLDLVRWGLERDEQGTPRIRFVKDALVHPPDPELIATNQPTCTEDEIPAYVFDRDSTGEVLKDQTDDKCADHGCDDLRYAVSENWKRDTKGPDAITTPRIGSFASQMMARNPEAVREWLEMDAPRARAALKEKATT